MSYEFGGCLFDTRRQWVTAAVQEYLSAGGLNGPIEIAEVFGEESDQEVLADMREGWGLADMEDHWLLEAIGEERSRYAVQIEDCGEFFNATLLGVEFTADKQLRDWGLRPEDNREAVKDAAEKIGVNNPDYFWYHVEPILNAAAGWGQENQGE